MRVLDLDLDFFLSDVAYHRSDKDGRLDSRNYSVWSPDDVDCFLAQKCGLSASSARPGRLVRHHHEVFQVWRDLIDSGDLTPPFEVVHVDAHADMGTGDAGYIYLMGDILHRNVSQRSHPELGPNKMNAGNFLAFALACRWIDKLVYVPNPKSSPDLFEWYFRNGDSRSGVIQLQAVPQQFLSSLVSLEPIIAMNPTEADIPFQLVTLDAFSDSGTFDFITCAQSPPFTPPEADDLISVIRKYMRSS